MATSTDENMKESSSTPASEQDQTTNNTAATIVPDEDSAKVQGDTPLHLPAPSKDSQSTPQQIDMSSGSGSIKMDHLGPLVVNADGTLSRIGNWEGMTERERENTLRILGKRNQARLKTLREGGGHGGSGKAES